MFVAKVSLGAGWVVVIGLAVVVVVVVVIGLAVVVGAFVEPVVVVVIVIGLAVVVGAFVEPVVLIGEPLVVVVPSTETSSSSLFTLTKVTIDIANVATVKTVAMATIGTKNFMHLTSLYALILLSIYRISVDKNEIIMMNRDANKKVILMIDIYKERLEEKKKIALRCWSYLPSNNRYTIITVK